MFSNHGKLAVARAGRPTRGQTIDLPTRQPVDADVQKAADDRAEATGSATTPVEVRVMTAAEASSSAAARPAAEERRRRRQAHAAGRRRSRRACRWDRAECRGSTPARTSGGPVRTGRPSRRVNASTIVCSASMSSSASSWISRRSASLSQPVDFGRLPNRLPHQPRRRAIAPSRQRRRRQRPQPPRRARDLAAPARTTPRRPGSRAATSNARTRCPACTPIYRVVRAVPFRGARSPGRAGRRRRDTARRGKSRQTGRRC